MDNEQHDTGSRFNLNRTHRMPALFFCIPIDAVRIDQATFVLEDQRGQFKGNSVVFSLVPTILRLIPFVTHRVYTQCTTGRLRLYWARLPYALRNQRSTAMVVCSTQRERT
jgi:predicted DCC family thiol-disulfide oxidoreductase YuxK